jgi:hypothetical protein
VKRETGEGSRLPSHLSQLLIADSLLSWSTIMLTATGVILSYLICLFLLRRMTRHSVLQLSMKELSLAFGFKVLLGCLYGYIYFTYYGGDDTWMFHRESIDEYHELFRNPGLFFKDFSPVPSFEQADNFIQGMGLYAANLEKQLMFKMLAIFNIFSRQNYYINVVFFNFIVFWGHYWLLRLLCLEFPSKRTEFFLVIFFFPPVVFWLSGIRADGLLLFFMSMMLVQLYHWWILNKRFSFLRMLLALAGLIIFRNMLALLVIPGIVALLLTVRRRRNGWLTFGIVYGISIILFFGSTLLSPHANLPAQVVKKQQEYFTLKGNTRFKLDTLQASAGSFIKLLPQAVNNTFLRPHPWEARDKLQIMASLDNLLLWALVILFLFKKEAKWKRDLSDPLILFFLFFSISLYLFIGYTVPFPGAIIRYKAIAELFILLMLVLAIKWTRNTSY